MIPGLVSAMLVTKRDRLDLARQALRDIAAQSWSAIEVMFVCDVRPRGLPTNAVFILALSGETLGELRNRALDAARGEFFVQFDDDDRYHPDRIKAQIEELHDAAADVCVLSRWTLTCGLCGFEHVSHQRPWEGSFLGRTEILRRARYPSMARGEDSHFLRALGDVVCVGLDAPELIRYTFHGRNTWDVEHFQENFDAAGADHDLGACLKKARMSDRASDAR